MYKQATIYKTGSIYKLDGGAATPDNFEVPKALAIVNDAVYIDALGTAHFVRASTLDAETIPEGWTLKGVVAQRKSDKLVVLHKTENTSVKWASMWLFKVNGLKLDGTDSFVLQQGQTSGNTPVVVGTFTATEAATDLDTLVSELDTWLRANPGDTSTCYEYNWHCAKINGRIWVIADFGSSPNYRQYTTLHGSGTTSGVATNTNMWTFAGFSTDYTQMQRADGKVGGSTLWNTSRAKQYMASSGNIGDPTDTNPDDSSGIYSEANFTAANCPNTYAKYNGDYDAYLESKLIKYPSSAGAMPVYAGDGRRANDAMASVSYVPLAGGNAVKMFTAVDYAKQRKAHATASVPGLNAGDWYIPGYDEIFEIFKQMKTDGSDRINSAFVQSNGSARSLSVSRWVPARSATTGAWLLYASGYPSGSSFGNTYRACAVALLEF